MAGGWQREGRPPLSSMQPFRAAPEFRLQGQRQPVERPCLHGPSDRRHQRGLRSSECPAPTLAAATPSDALNPSRNRYRNVRMQGRKRHSDNRHTLRTQPRTRPGKARCPTTRRATSHRTADHRGIMPEGQKQTIERPCQGHASGASDPGLWPEAPTRIASVARGPVAGRGRGQPCGSGGAVDHHSDRSQKSCLQPQSGRPRSGCNQALP